MRTGAALGRKWDNRAAQALVTATMTSAGAVAAPPPVSALERVKSALKRPPFVPNHVANHLFLLNAAQVGLYGYSLESLWRLKAVKLPPSNLFGISLLQPSGRGRASHQFRWSAFHIGCHIISAPFSGYSGRCGSHHSPGCWCGSTSRGFASVGPTARAAPFLFYFFS